MSHSQDTGPEAYYVPHEGSLWPAVAILGMATGTVGASMYMNESAGGLPLLGIGFTIILVMFYGWLRSVIRESMAGLYNAQMDRSFRQGMQWFIFSEVMFFAAFFGALWYVRTIALPWIGGDGNNLATNIFIWGGWENTWPTNGPAGLGGDFKLVDPWHLPLYNTLLLLASGVTLEIAHHGLLHGQRKKLIGFLAATVGLGVWFLYLQAAEYVEAYQHLNLTLESGVYGSTFFLLTGFHGMHVTLGTIMLAVILVRCIKGHFTAESHFGFEGVAWYWHFVDVVWLGLFIFVYII